MVGISPKPMEKLTRKEQRILDNRWNKKRSSIHNLKHNISRLKRKIRLDLQFGNEKQKLTALIIRIMMCTSERVGNEDSANDGHFGVTHFKNKHVKVDGSRIILDYVGKSGVEHEKSFCDETAAKIISELLQRNNEYLFTTSDGFRIKPDKVNRYLRYFDATSKDIRGFNANRKMVMLLNQMGKVKEEKLRPRIFNKTLRQVASKIGHNAPTLRKHYLLPEIEKQFYETGSIGRLKID